MTIPLKPEAEALRLGMLAGIFTRAEAVTWADLAIAELDKPGTELIDLSTSDGLDGSSFAALLSSVPGAPDAALTNRILIAQLRAKLLKGAAPASLVPSLTQLAELVALSPEEKTLASRLSGATSADAAKALSAYDLSGKTRLIE